MTSTQLLSNRKSQVENRKSAPAYRLSRTAQTLKRSVMRDLLARVSEPGILNFAGGLPADENLPHAQLRECFDAALTRGGTRALQYGPPYAPLKEWIAAYMQRRGVECSADEIFITNGNQQGLELCARLFLDDGAAVAVEEFTFTGVLQAAQGHGAEVVPMAVDLEEGVDPHALVDIGRRNPALRMAVVIPDFHNPLGVSMNGETRRVLAESASRLGIPLVEDAPYAPLQCEGMMCPPCKAYDENDNVIYLGSFSKMIAPALRLGWMVAPRELIPRLTVLRESLDLESSQWTQRAVAEFLERGYLEPHLAHLNAANLKRRNRMLAALQRELGDIATWTVPQGGLFTWVTLPSEINTRELLNAALTRQVAFVPGIAFAARPETGASSMRINFANAPEECIEEGVRRLAEAVKVAMSNGR